MNKYPINIKGTITEERLQKGVFIFIYRASKIPPHIGLVVNGLLYDITAVGPNIGLPLADFYKTAVKRKTEILFVELKKANFSMLNELISALVEANFKVTIDTSCLTPVKEFIYEAYAVDVDQTNFIFELLPVLFQKELITAVWELNLSKKIEQSVFEMTKYTKQDVANCVAALKRKEQFSC